MKVRTKIDPRLKELANVSERVVDIIRVVTEDAKQCAKDNVRVDTGALRDSITAQVDPQQIVGVLDVGEDYADYVEFGTRFMEAKPFIRPATLKGRKTLYNEMAKLEKRFFR